MLESYVHKQKFLQGEMYESKYYHTKLKRRRLD